MVERFCSPADSAPASRSFKGVPGFSFTSLAASSTTANFSEAMLGRRLELQVLNYLNDFARTAQSLASSNFRTAMVRSGLRGSASTSPVALDHQAACCAPVDAPAGAHRQRIVEEEPSSPSTLVEEEPFSQSVERDSVGPGHLAMS
jgi:hypothetical protein